MKLEVGKMYHGRVSCITSAYLIAEDTAQVLLLLRTIDPTYWFSRPDGLVILSRTQFMLWHEGAECRRA